MNIFIGLVAFCECFSRWRNSIKQSELSLSLLTLRLGRHHNTIAKLFIHYVYIMIIYPTTLCCAYQQEMKHFHMDDHSECIRCHWSQQAAET